MGLFARLEEAFCRLADMVFASPKEALGKPADLAHILVASKERQNPVTGILWANPMPGFACDHLERWHTAATGE